MKRVGGRAEFSRCRSIDFGFELKTFDDSREYEYKIICEDLFFGVEPARARDEQ